MAGVVIFILLIVRKIVHLLEILSKFTRKSIIPENYLVNFRSGPHA